MKNELVEKQDLGRIEQVLINGDLSRLTEVERLKYYKNVCETLGLNPLTKPFDYISLNGKLTLYARKDATDQLRKIHKVSIKISSRATIEGVHIVTAIGSLPDGRADESVGAVPTSNLKGDVLANAFMKAETKAKRRVTLSICGLGIFDETEVENIRGGVYPEQPEPGDGVPFIEEYRVPGGKWAKRGLNEIDPKEMADYITSKEELIKRKPEKKPEWWDDFVFRAEQFIGDLENALVVPEEVEVP